MSRPYFTRLEDGIGYLLNDLIRVKDQETWAITLANELKAVYNAHLASTDWHTTDDATNVVTSANATDLASLYTLLNELRGDYAKHRILVGGGPVHGSADTVHATTAPIAADLDTAVALLKDLAYHWMEHKLDVSGSPAIHLAEDTDRFFWQYVKKVAHFGGRIEDILEVKKKATAGAPFILVQAQGGNPKMVTAGGIYHRETMVSLLLIDRSVRSQEAQRRGSDHALEPPGLYQMVEDVCDRIVNQLPVDGAGVAIPSRAWRLVADNHEYGDLDIQIWLLTFQAKVAHEWAQVDRSSLNDLQRAHGEGDLYQDGVKIYDALTMTLNTWP